MVRRSYRPFVFLLITAFVLACMPAFPPASAPAATYDPNSINTAIVQTANAAATQTALIVSSTPTPTDTPLPTFTPTATLSPTVTFIFLLATPTVPSATPQPGSSGLRYECQIMLKTPADDTHMPPNNSFSMIWQVRNMGTDSWDGGSTDYRYKGGDKLHKTEVYDLPSSVESGGQTELKVSMKSPSPGGTYSTRWVIKTGKTEFCNLSLTIHVP